MTLLRIEKKKIYLFIYLIITIKFNLNIKL